MHTATTPAAHVSTQHRARALSAVGGAAAALLAWAAEVPLLGVRLSFRFGAMPAKTLPAGEIAGAALVAGLLGWLLLAVLERRTRRARSVWTVTALVIFAASLALPLAAATTASATAGLIVVHLAVAAAVVPSMARTAR